MANNKASVSRWRYLIKRYMTGTCSKGELDELLREEEDATGHEILASELRNFWENPEVTGASHAPDWEKRYAEMMEDISSFPPGQPSGRRVILRRWWRMAAAVLMLIAGASLWWFTRPVHHQGIAQSGVGRADIQPGGNKAILILANGSAIALDSAKNGSLTNQGNTRVLKAGNGQLVYDAAAGQQGKVLYNRIVTPKGGQYQIVLPDGTRVWLNAVSSLRFPTAFSGKARVVELTGEGYFEVAENAGVPFEVQSHNMTVKVLGTRFNIMSYEDESTIETTLLDGAVSVLTPGGNTRLSPGQEASMNRSSDKISVARADVEATVAWKNGLFKFDHADLQTIMRQIARWYDVEVTYQGPVPDRKFTGMMSRKVGLSHVLKVLALSNVHFKVNDRKITVFF